MAGQIRSSPGLMRAKRGVAQLVAYHVRDVGVGSSSLLTPTKEKARHDSAGLFCLKQTQACLGFGANKKDHE